jgi:hypothetical protein
LSAEIIGMRGCALAYPALTFERWESLSVAGDVRCVASQACACVGESVLRELTVSRGFRNAKNSRAQCFGDRGCGCRKWVQMWIHNGRVHTESQVFALTCPLGQTSRQVFCCARHQLRRTSLVTLLGSMVQQLVKFACAEASPAIAATTSVEKSIFSMRMTSGIWLQEL